MSMQTKTLSVYGLSIILGILTGAIGSFFQLAISWTTEGYKWLIQFSIDKGSPPWLMAAFLSMSMAVIAWWLVVRFASEASGSGVQEIEGTLLHKRKIFWHRLLPVKFIGGTLAIASNLVVGREGPTIQMGGNLGGMLGDLAGLKRNRRDSLIAAGAAAGLATAFNAPLAGVLLIIEEMRNEFNFNFTNFKMVAIACVFASISMQSILGSAPAIVMDVYNSPPLKSLWLFFIFGIVMGFAGLLFNVLLMKTLNYLDRFNRRQKLVYVAFVGALIGYLFTRSPGLVGGGYTIIHQSLTLSPTVDILFFSALGRWFLTLLSYNTSVPGGIFAPMLSLGTLLGLICYPFLEGLVPDAGLYPGMFAVVGMAALFSSAIRAPITGIVLVVEMTQNYSLILPLMLSCLTSTTVVQLAKNGPIYTQLLRRTLKRS